MDGAHTHGGGGITAGGVAAAIGAVVLLTEHKAIGHAVELLAWVIGGTVALCFVVLAGVLVVSRRMHPRKFYDAHPHLTATVGEPVVEQSRTERLSQTRPMPAIAAVPSEVHQHVHHHYYGDTGVQQAQELNK